MPVEFIASAGTPISTTSPKFDSIGRRPSAKVLVTVRAFGKSLTAGYMAASAKSRPLLPAEKINNISGCCRAASKNAVQSSRF